MKKSVFFVILVTVVLLDLGNAQPHFSIVDAKYSTLSIAPIITGGVKRIAKLYVYPPEMPTSAITFGTEDGNRNVFWNRASIDPSTGVITPGIIGRSQNGFSSEKIRGILLNGNDAWICVNGGFIYYVKTNLTSSVSVLVTLTGHAVQGCTSDLSTGYSYIRFDSSICRFKTSELPKVAGTPYTPTTCYTAPTIDYAGLEYDYDFDTKISANGNLLFFQKEIFDFAACAASKSYCNTSLPVDKIVSINSNNVISSFVGTSTVLYQYNPSDGSHSLLASTYSLSEQFSGSINVNPNAYYGVTADKAWRLFIDDFAYEKIESSPFSKAFTSGAMIDVSPCGDKFALIGSIDTDGYMGFITVQTAKCDSVSQATCLTDSHYCRWDLYDQNCITIYKANTVYCNSTYGTHCLTEVRTVNSITPNIGSTAGGTLVSIDVDELWSDDPNLKCVFGSQQVPGNYSSLTKTVSCQTPTGSKGNVMVNVIYKSKNVATVSPSLFAYYDCSSAELNTCRSCTTYDTQSIHKSECAWCPLSRACVSSISQTCSRGDKSVSDDQSCPQIVGINPSRGPMSGTTETTITCLNIIEGQNYYCKFGNNFDLTKPAILDIATSSVKCNATPYTSTFSQEVVEASLYLDSTTRFVSTDTKAYYKNFTYFSCDSYLTCATCTAGSCNWCIDGTAHTFGCSSTCSTGANSYSTCPAKVSFTPPYVNLEEGTGTTTATVQVKLTDLVSGFNYSCPDPNTPAAFDVATKTVTCVIGKPTTTEGGMPVQIYATFGSTQSLFADAGNFYYFNCSLHGTSCSDCVSQESGLCGWCMNDIGKCSSQTNCPGIGSWANPTCPTIISFEPNNYIDAENPVVIVNGSAFPAARSFSCSLSLDGAVISTVSAVNLQTGKTLNCSFGTLPSGTMPNYNITKQVKLIISETNKKDTTFDTLANGNSTNLVNCTQNVISTTCSDCVTSRSSYCSWSRGDGYCTTKDRAHYSVAFGNSGKCPSLSIIDPSAGSAKGGFAVTIVGSEFINDSSLVLRFLDEDDSTIEYIATTSFINSTRLTATTPKTSKGRYSTSLYLSETKRVFAENPLLFFDVTSDTNLGVIIGPIAAGALLIIIAVIIAAILIARKRRGQSDFKFDLSNEPDFARYSYATDLCSAAAAAACKPDTKVWQPLRQVLLEPQVSAAICDVTQATEADRVANSLVYIYAAASRAASLVLDFASDEVSSVPNENQLFRGNSMASKSFRAFSRMVGLRYLWLTLARFVNELEHLAGVSDKKPKSVSNVELENGGNSSSGAISILSTDIEIDPTKLSEGADEESQAYLLAQRSRALLITVMGSIPNMPSSIRWILHNIKKQVERRFPGSEHVAIGGTVFLRFICPSITVPHTYALLKNAPNDRLQRQLILLSKVLQNLANGVLFGKKEPFMNNMNEFIAKNIAPLQEWMDKLADVGSDSSREDSISVPSFVIAGSLVFLQGHMIANLPKLRTALQNRGASPQLIQSVENALSQAPPPS